MVVKKNSEKATKCVHCSEVLEFYKSNGINTDPGKELDQFKILPAVPDGIPAICKIIQENLCHLYLTAFVGKELYGFTLADIRQQGREPLDENSTESVQQLLLEQKNLVITKYPDTKINYNLQSRPIETRHIAICRMYAALLVSILRSKGLAARIRCGFARYLNPGMLDDHYLCEYYHPDDQRWILVDAQLDQMVIDLKHIPFNPCDVPRTMFLTAGEAWRQYKEGKIEAEKCGIVHIRGAEFIRGNIIMDMANLNKVEPQPWAMWGYRLKGDPELTPSDWDVIEEMASLTQCVPDDDQFAKIRDIYQKNPMVRVPEGFKSPHFRVTGIQL